MENNLMYYKNLFNFSKIKLKNSNYCSYGYENLFWLELFLQAFQFKSIESKRKFLLKLKSQNALKKFYHKIGIQFHKKTLNPESIPAKSTFSEYKKALLHLKSTIQLIHKVVQMKLEQSLSLNKFLHVAIDGKDIRNTGTGLRHRDNLKSIHFYTKGLLLYDEFTTNENGWIKDNLNQSLKKFKKFIKSPMIFTGDCAYNNRKTQTFYDKHGLYYLLSFKSNFYQQDELLNFKKLVSKGSRLDKQGGKTIQHQWSLYQLKPNHRNITFYLEVIKTVSHKGNDKVIIQKYLTNHPDQNIPFFDIKMNHWNVETYHHLKDTKLNEDRYRKSKENAKIYAMLNNIIAFTYEDKKLDQSDIENFKIDLMFWIFIKIYRTVLILIDF